MSIESADLDTEIARRLQAGESYRVIMDALSVGSFRIARIARATAGIPPWHSKRRKQIEELLQQDQRSYAAIARQVGVSRQWVHAIARQLRPVLVPLPASLDRDRGRAGRRLGQPL